MQSEETDFLKELMIHVSKKIGRPYSALAEMEDQLRRNWYDSPEAIGGISDEQFQKMGIPLRVVSVLREEVGGLSCKSPRQSQPPKEMNPQKEEKPVEKVRTEKPGNQLNEATILILTGRLEDKLLQKYPWVGSEILNILETIYKIIKNIVSDSYEYKYRVLKKSNARIREVILGNPPVLNFLKEIGFEEDEETVYLDVVNTNAYFYIEECLQAMVENHKKQNQNQNQAINKAGQKYGKSNEPLFLPPDLKLPSTNSVDLQGSFPKEHLEEANYAEMLDKLVLFRKKIMSTPPADRKIRIYHKRHDKREVSHVIFDMDNELVSSDNAVIANYWKNEMKNNQKKANFQSKRKIEFEFLISQQVYKETTIKLRLPNELIIEARFGPLQTLADVFNMAAEIVIGEFYIYQAPPVKLLNKEMHRTLDSLESVPFGYFFVGLKSEWYIKNEYFTKIIQ